MPGSIQTDVVAERGRVGRSDVFRQNLFVLGLASALRLCVAWAVIARYPRGWFFSRGLEMGLLANSLLAGRGLGSPFGGETGPTAFIAPGYPVLVAVVFRVFGSESVGSLGVLLGAQIVANLVTVWLVMRVARELGGMRAAWIAGVFWACSLPLIWMPTIFWDTCLSACVVLGAIALALRWRGRFDRNIAMVCGIAGAAAGLVNPALLPALGSVVVWLACVSGLSTRFKVARLALAAAAFVVVFAPWPTRNARVFHAFIPLRTTVGFELWMGNRPGATGYLDESIFPMYNAGELAEYKAVGEVAYTGHKSELAKAYIVAHPGTFMAMTARRVVRFWTGTGNQTGSWLFGLHAGLSTVLGLGGLWWLFRQRRVRTGMLFALPLLLFPLPYYMTHAEFRYRLVIDPVLTVLGGCWLAMLSERRSPVSAAAVLVDVEAAIA